MTDAHRVLQTQDALNRRVFLSSTAGAVGSTALASLLMPSASAQAASSEPHLPAKAKRIIYLFQSGAPSQMDLFDPKPEMEKRRGEDLPDSIRQGQRLTTMTSGQTTFPVAPSIFRFAQHGECGMWFSELVPHMARHADRWCMVRSMVTEQINHDPAITFFQTGHQLAGRPSIGSWLSYGLGSDNADLPAYIVLTSFGSGRTDDQPLYDRLWGAGFLPTEHQGVRFRNAGDPVLYLADPPGLHRDRRRATLDRIAALNGMRQTLVGDPEIAARTAQYEMAFRMQTSVPEIVDFSDEPRHVIESYGPDVARPGSYAANCLLARRMIERGVRFVQLYHADWDHHADVSGPLEKVTREVDRPTAALIKDLKQRGLLDDTLVIFGGEFGRTPMAEVREEEAPGKFGRNHHIDAFPMLMTGGKIRRGHTIGETDDLGFSSVGEPIHVHDIQATILHMLGLDHTKLTYTFQGRPFRLTDVGGRVLHNLFA